MGLEAWGRGGAEEEEEKAIRATGVSRATFGVIESSAGTTKPYLWFCHFYHHQNHSPPPAQSHWSGGGPPSPPPLLNPKYEIMQQIQDKTMMR